MKKLNCIMLVEDDDTVNFYNKFLIEEADLANQVVVATNGQEAIDYLLKCQKDSSIVQPDLIFLDINMPVMNGFEFLEEFEKSAFSDKIQALIVMLTTSLHPSDKERASQYDSITDYVYKPLMEAKLKEIAGSYFEN